MRFLTRILYMYRRNIKGVVICSHASNIRDYCKKYGNEKGLFKWEA